MFRSFWTSLNPDIMQKVFVQQFFCFYFYLFIYHFKDVAGQSEPELWLSLVLNQCSDTCKGKTLVLNQCGGHMNGNVPVTSLHNLTSRSNNFVKIHQKENKNKEKKKGTH